MSGNTVLTSCSVLEYMRDHSGYKCGYCKSSNTNFSHGMWAHRMAVGDYQNLIDRGWRRSGKYCYKPTMDKTCCPMYTIKCDALDLKLSKSQKKVLKRMHRYLSYGNSKESEGNAAKNEYDGVSQGAQEYLRPQYEMKQDLSSISLSDARISKAKCCDSSKEVDNNDSNSDTSLVSGAQGNTALHRNDSGNVKRAADAGSNYSGSRNKNTGPDFARPLCRKAKDIRRERREAKLAKRAQEALSHGESLMEVGKRGVNNVSKTLEDFINEPLPDDPAHVLEVRLVRSQPSSTEFLMTFKTAHEVYQKYQINIHGDTPRKCCESQFKRFLCNSPLEPWKPANSPPQGYGSFHHQYWLDGRLIAVGVLDVLPYCISSVYLYYDPAFSFLSLGTYASLRELALTRELQKAIPTLKWYYMGFYIHSCPKMRYKGSYSPSFLLCPETYTWEPIENCKPKLDVSKYSRLNDDPSAVDVNGRVDIDKVLVLHEGELILFETYRLLNEDTDDEVKEYATLVGAESAYSMVLFRN